VQSFDQPFPEILNTTWDRFDVPGRNLSKHDEAYRYDPRHQHRVCDCKVADLKDWDRLQRYRRLLLTPGRCFFCRKRGRCHGEPAKQHHYCQQKTTIAHFRYN
jgi:hypothetical protein